jgi:predicted transcriptional regulator
MLYLQIAGDQFMAETSMKEYRLRARLSIAQLARLAQVDDATVRRAETGQPVQEVKAYAIAEALSQAVGQHLSISDLGIVIY